VFLNSLWVCVCESVWVCKRVHFLIPAMRHKGRPSKQHRFWSAKIMHFLLSTELKRKQPVCVKQRCRHLLPHPPKHKPTHIHTYTYDAIMPTLLFLLTLWARGPRFDLFLYSIIGGYVVRLLGSGWDRMYMDSQSWVAWKKVWHVRRRCIHGFQVLGWPGKKQDGVTCKQAMYTWIPSVEWPANKQYGVICKQAVCTWISGLGVAWKGTGAWLSKTKQRHPVFGSAFVWAQKVRSML